MIAFKKKDSYIPALRVDSEFAERAQDACDKLFLHPPKIRREWWEDLIRIAESGQTLLRPVRTVTQELLAELSHTSIDEIKMLFPAPSAPSKKPILAYAAAATVVAAAIAIVCLGPFLVERYLTGQVIARITPAAQSTPAITPLPALPSPSAIAQSDTAPMPEVTPAPLAPPPDLSVPLRPPKITPTPEPLEQQIATPQAPSRLAYTRVIVKKVTVSAVKTTETKGEAVAQASKKWDRKELSIDKQLAMVDRAIAKTRTPQTKGDLQEFHQYLQQKKTYVRRSRTYHQNQIRLAWNQKHGASPVTMLVDSVRANLGF